MIGIGHDPPDRAGEPVSDVVKVGDHVIDRAAAEFGFREIDVAVGGTQGRKGLARGGADLEDATEASRVEGFLHRLDGGMSAVDVADGDSETLFFHQFDEFIDAIDCEAERLFDEQVRAERREAGGDGNVGRRGSRDNGGVVVAVGEGALEVGKSEVCGDPVAPGDLGAPRSVGFAKGDRVAAFQLLETAQMPLPDGAGADDEEFHERGWEVGPNRVAPTIQPY